MAASRRYHSGAPGGNLGRNCSATTPYITCILANSLYGASPMYASHTAHASGSEQACRAQRCGACWALRRLGVEHHAANFAGVMKEQATSATGNAKQASPSVQVIRHPCHMNRGAHTHKEDSRGAYSECQRHIHRRQARPCPLQAFQAPCV